MSKQSNSAPTAPFDGSLGQCPPNLAIGIALVVTWLSFGSTFLAIKIALHAVPPLLIATLNLLGAGAVLLAWQWPRERETLGWTQWRSAVIQGILLFCCGRALVVFGTQYLSSGVAALLSATTPLWVALLGTLVFHLRLTPRVIVGLLAGFGGMVILIAPTSSHLRLNGIGIAILTVSAISWAIGSLRARNATDNSVRPLVATAMQMLAGGTVLLIVSGLTGECGHVHGVSTSSALAVIYLTIVVAFIGFTTFAWLLRATSAALANSFAFVSPVVAMTLGHLVLHEPLTGRMIVASVIILLGVIVMATAPAPSVDQ